MNPVQNDCVSSSNLSAPPRSFHRGETRLEALCDLIDEELNNGGIANEELATYARRITGDIDQAMTEEFCWISDSDFM